jgi:hypothetical protein
MSTFGGSQQSRLLACIEAAALSSIMLAVHETPATPYPKPRLLERIRDAIRTRHYSRETEKAYVHWIKRYIFFHNKRHPADMGAPEVARFLTSLAIDAHVASSTQNQALNGAAVARRRCARQAFSAVARRADA